MNSISIIIVIAVILAIIFLVGLIMVIQSKHLRRESQRSKDLEKIVNVSRWFLSYFCTGVPHNDYAPFRLLSKAPFIKAKEYFSKSLRKYLSNQISKQDLTFLGMVIQDFSEINNREMFSSPEDFDNFTNWFEGALDSAMVELKDDMPRATTMYLNTLLSGMPGLNVPCLDEGKKYFERIPLSDSEWAKQFFAGLQHEIEKHNTFEPNWLSENSKAILTGELLKLQHRLGLDSEEGKKD